MKSSAKASISPCMAKWFSSVGWSGAPAPGSFVPPELGRLRAPLFYSVNAKTTASPTHDRIISEPPVGAAKGNSRAPV